MITKPDVVITCYMVVNSSLFCHFDLSDITCIDCELKPEFAFLM